MSAPVCNLTPSEPPATATVLTIPSIPLPTATNMQAVVTALRQTVLTLTNQLNNLTRQNNNNPSNNPPKTPQQQKSGFYVTHQTVSQVKVLDPNDPSGNTFVTVNQVTALQLVNKVTGEVWVWQAPAGIP
jgi:hypothetical protein